MMKDLSSSVESLTKKTEGLISAYEQTSQKLRSLEEENRSLGSRIEDLNGEVERLQEENKVLRMASAIKGDEEKVTESKRRISQLVREIDRCIALLND